MISNYEKEAISLAGSLDIIFIYMASPLEIFISFNFKLCLHPRILFKEALSFKPEDNTHSPKEVVSEQINSPTPKTHHSNKVVHWHGLSTSHSEDHSPHQEHSGEHIIEKVLKAGER